MRQMPWETKAKVARDILANSIKTEWMLSADKLPVKDRLDVTNVPKECGLLTEKEIMITETDATGLVERMAEGLWSAEEVLIAFAKRATIGHQLVRPNSIPGSHKETRTDILAAQLRNRVHD